MRISKYFISKFIPIVIIVFIAALGNFTLLPIYADNAEVDAVDDDLLGILPGTSLREAIDIANLNPGLSSFITFDASISGATLTLDDDLPTITNDVFIDTSAGSCGTFPNSPEVTIDAQGNNVFDVALSGTLTVNGLEIINAGTAINLLGDESVISCNIFANNTTDIIMNNLTFMLIEKNSFSGADDAIQVINGSGNSLDIVDNFFGVDSGDADNGGGVRGINIQQGDHITITGNHFGFLSESAVIVTNNSSINNQIEDNVFVGMTQMPIDLNDNNVNETQDSGDSDTGPNNLQNYPEILYSTASDFKLELDSNPNTDFNIQIYATDSCLASPANGGAGGIIVADIENVGTDSSGILILNDVISGVSNGDFVSAIAINTSNDDTSEFSPCVEVKDLPTLDISDLTQVEGSSGDTTTFSVDFTLSEAVAYDIQLTLIIDGTATSGGDYDAITENITIPANTTIFTLDINVDGDEDVESDETIELSIDSIDGAQIGESGTVTIVNDDFAPLAIDSPANGFVMPAGIVGEVYSGVTVAASGGVTPYIFSQLGLPAGMTIDSVTGVIGGTPTATLSAGDIDVTVTDSNSPTASTVTFTYTLTVYPDLLISAPTTGSTVSFGIVGEVYSGETVTVTGGSGTHTFSAPGLPAGMTIDSSTGIIGGTPTVAFNSSFIVTVTDSINGDTATATYNLTVYDDLVITSPTDGSTITDGVVNEVYAGETVTVTGGSGTRTFGATGLPAAMTIDSSTGVIGGTPTGTFSGTVTVTVTDSVNADTASADYTLTVYNDLLITSPSDGSTLTGGIVNEVYGGETVTVSGGSGTHTFSAPGLPAGMTIDSSTGIISGTPTVAFNSTVTVTVTDTINSDTASASYNLTIDPDLLISSPTDGSVITNGIVGVLYSDVTVTVTGGTGTHTFSAPGLPAGLSIDSTTGIISGTPTVTFSGIVTVTVTDSGNGDTASADYTLSVYDDLLITSPTNGTVLADGTVGIAYAGVTVTVSGGSGTHTFSAINLPTGMTIDTSTGVIGGTPTATLSAGTVTVTVTDSINGDTASADYTLTVNAAPNVTIITPADGSALPFGIVGTVYSGQTVTATGGSGTYVFSSVTLPAGLSIDSAGAISGTPTVAFSGTVTIIVTDTVTSDTDSADYSLTVYDDLLITSPTDGTVLADGTVGAAYAGVTVTVSGGSGTHTFSAIGLPTGMTIDTSTGVIGGTPTATLSAGTVTVTVTDTVNGDIASADYTLTVNLASTVSIDTPVDGSTLPFGIVATVYSGQTVTATGGSGSYAFSSVTLPAGLSIDSAGLISGTPTVAFSGTVTIIVTDTVTLDTDSADYTLTIYDDLLITSPTNGTVLTDGTVGVAYAGVTVTVSGGSGTRTFGATGLPTGMTIDSSTGIIGGTPTATLSAGTVTVTVTDSVNGDTVTADYTLTVNVGSTVAISSPADGSTLPSGIVGTVYSGQTVTATGGSGSYVFSSVTLPAGLSIDSAGAISGTPTVAFSGTVTIIVTDTVTTDTDSADYTLTIYDDLLITNPTNGTVLADGTVGVAYAGVTVTATGGSGTRTFGATGLPTGMSIDSSTGIIGGTPTATLSAGTVTVTVTDSVNGDTASANYTLTVITSGTPVSIVTPVDGSALTAGTQFVVYAGQSFTAQDGTTPYTWSVSGLPAGLSMNPSTGAITGAPTASGNFNVVVTVNAANATSDTNNYTMSITAAISPITIISPDVFILTDGFLGSAYSITQFQATGGSTTFYNWVATNLPNNMFIDGATGQLQGIPNVAGTRIITITAEDGVNTPGTRQYQLTIQGSLTPISISSPNSANLPTGTQNSAYTVTIVATGGTGSYTYSASGLPTGLSINSSSGLISGTPTQTGTFSVNVIAADGTNPSGSRTYSLVINAVDANAAGYASNPAPGSTINFGGVAVGTSSTLNLVVSEDGGSVLNVTIPAGGSITGNNAAEFALTSVTPPFSISNGGASLTIAIRCTPAAAGERHALLTFNTNDPDLPTVLYSLYCVGDGVVATGTPGTPGAGGDNGTVTLPTATPLPSTYGIVVGVEGLSLRRGPFIGASRREVLRPDTYYTVIGKSNAEGVYMWYLIILPDGRLGWASGRYLNVYGLDVPFVGSELDNVWNERDRGVHVQALDNVFLRPGPSTRTQPYPDLIPWGTDLSVYARTVSGRGDEWYAVRSGDRFGWVYAPNVKLVQGLMDAIPVY